MFCENGVTFSFNSPDAYMEGEHTYGGFSKKYVCEDKYVLKMPAFEDLASAAPLLCAGITVYSPLRHWGAGPDKKVGVLGIGGLGHLAIKIAKAMGAEVTVFTTSPSKVEDAKRLGADKAVLSSDPEQMQAAMGSQDIIIDTVSAKHDVNQYLGMLKVDGSLVLVGLPPENLEVGAFNVVMGRKSFSGSNIGGIAETQEMLDFCYEHNIVAESEIINIQDVNEAFERLEKGDVKYRFVIDMASL
jgi:alcohol dehydrogenase (NADP+)